jgi:FKBP-type peptidyl-prolyl cis-trans isomerase
LIRKNILKKAKKKKEMKSIFVLVLVCIVFLSLKAQANEETKKAAKKQLQIGIKKKVENCSITSKKGDSLSMHYTGKLGNLVFKLESASYQYI